MEYDLMPPEAAVSLSFFDKTTGVCTICKKEKHISSWVIIEMDRECGEYDEFIENFGKEPIKICFNCYIRPVLKQVGIECELKLIPPPNGVGKEIQNLKS